MKVRVMKAFISDGKMLEVGSIVDASSWKNVKTLESSRYVSPVYFETESETTKEIKPKASTKA